MITRARDGHSFTRPLPVPRPAPFPHLLLDSSFWEPELLAQLIGEFPPPNDPRWRRYSNDREGKLEGSDPDMWGPATRRWMDAAAGLADDLGEIFGIPKLTMETIGGGYHLIPPGGRLDVHYDFNRSPATGLHRRLNLLTYLNPRWEDPGGHLLLGAPDDPTRVDVIPELGRTLIFATSDRSWHGHPTPARRWRLSIAAYYFSPQPAVGGAEHSTVWWPG